MMFPFVPMVFSHWKLDEIDIFPASIASPHEAM
jgi:hypothetical protein